MSQEHSEVKSVFIDVQSGVEARGVIGSTGRVKSSQRVAVKVSE